MKPAFLLLLTACASASQDTTPAEYTVSLTLLDLSAAVLLRDAAALREYLSDDFTIQRRPWGVDPLLEAIRRTIRKISVLEARFDTDDGRTVPLSLTHVEPDSELVKLFRRQPPHENVQPDVKALRQVGVRGNRIYGRARCWALAGETVEVDFTLEIRIESSSVRIQSLEFIRR